MTQEFLHVCWRASGWNFERALIRERQAEGIALAKAPGKYQGQVKSSPPSSSMRSKEKVTAGVSKAKLARGYNVNCSTLYRALGQNG